ncbi:hypothetical protein BDV25DRAFT_168375 [Aspergillus avenaceus]|uniref:Phospholipase D n=1 Tax=Aspergillus avenaceus TaxID=36643 RepID=A0A5N6TQG4_ASPAV|nr:hypothetical protein BDV25DRAFT_168375 [Aspergillus avenaceus]
MRSIATLFCTLTAILGVAAAPAPTRPAKDSARPIYAIAHRVLTIDGVEAALSQGSNAIEVDLTAWQNWWADHDGTWSSAGASARELFSYMAQRRHSGANLLFVWLDIKNPDHCAEGKPCSIQALRDLVRETLEPAGVRALYGFYQTEHSDGFEVIRDSLNANEALCLSGSADYVMSVYNANAASVPISQRAMDYGGVNIRDGFGDCHEAGGKTCSELRLGREASDQGKLGKVLGWTTTEGDTLYVEDMLLMGVDGIIYGHQMQNYANDGVTKAALHDIQNYVNSHPATHRMATANDLPW